MTPATFSCSRKHRITTRARRPHRPSRRVQRQRTGARVVARRSSRWMTIRCRFEQKPHQTPPDGSLRVPVGAFQPSARIVARGRIWAVRPSSPRTSGARRSSGATAAANRSPILAAATTSAARRFPGCQQSQTTGQAAGLDQDDTALRPAPRKTSRALLSRCGALRVHLQHVNRLARRHE
jgi:hypothetical protein